MLYVLDDDAHSGSFSEALEAEFFTFLESVGSAPPASVTEIENVAGNQLLPLGVYVEPADANTLSHVWVNRLREGQLSDITASFSRELTENTYRFQGQTIYRIFLQSGQLYYAVQLRDWVLLSPSSSALENGVRSYLGLDSPLPIAESSLPLSSGTYIGFRGLEKQLQQLGQVGFRPFLQGSFTGLETTLLNVREDGENIVQIEAELQAASRRSAFTSAVSASPRRFEMSRYISSDAVAFGMFPAPRNFDERGDLPQQTSLDSLLTARPGRISSLTSTLGDEAAFAGYYTLGFSPLTESVFLRRVSDRSTLRAELERLVSEGYGTRNQEVYTFRGRALAKILGGDFCLYQNFSVGLIDNLLVITPRSGLIQRVASDINRRRVMYYDEGFTELIADLPEQQSAFLYIDNAGFSDFIEPYTDPVSPAMAYLPYFDVLTLSMTGGEGGNVKASARLHSLDRSEQPFAERWFYPLDAAELTGPPSIGRLHQGFRNDVVFATDNNRVVALAADGTRVFQASTGRDTPIGSPVLVDWYANNQTAVLIAAGNKVYGWNNRGQSLPNFPFELEERITAPILTADISRSGSPEAVVATADRRLHVLGGRGRNLSGWPQTTNGVILEQPSFELFKGAYSLWATAENALFSWNTDGSQRSGFPVFADAPLNGRLYFHDDAIFTGSRSGDVYALSEDGLFDEEFRLSDAPETGSGSDEFRFEAVNVAADPVRVSTVQQMTVRIPPEPEEEDEVAEAERRRMPVIALHSDGGSVFLYSLDGRLRFTASVGGDMAKNHTLAIADLNRDGKQELLALADAGRLYAWTVEEEQRLSGLPPAAMQYPVVSQLGTDGLLNIIAGTSEGVRVWAISN